MLVFMEKFVRATLWLARLSFNLQDLTEEKTSTGRLTFSYCLGGLHVQHSQEKSGRPNWQNETAPPGEPTTHDTLGETSSVPTLISTKGVTHLTGYVLPPLLPSPARRR